jgi:pimeloyl-ACP methyl ester carboxylesterase
MKQFIENRKGLKICVITEVVKDQKGLVFVMHGLGGFKEQPHLQTFLKSFQEEGFTTVLFDTTNTFGESEGDYENATTTNYYEDLCDVIEWSKSQEFYQEPFWLIGHSLGGISIALYAENFPDKVKGVAPISAVISGKLSLETKKHQEIDGEWRRTGWRETPSVSKPGLVKRLPWSHIEDRLKHDLLEKVDKLTMPVLLIVGDLDDGTPPEHQKILFDAISHENKELHIIKGAKHTFREEEHLKEIKTIIKNWIEKYN